MLVQLNGITAHKRTDTARCKESRETFSTSG